MPLASFGWTLGLVVRKEEARKSFGFNRDMQELTVAMMLRGQTSYLSLHPSSQGGPAFHASSGAQAEHMSLLYPFMARVSSDHLR